MVTASTLMTLTQIGVIGSVALGCATARRELGDGEHAAIQTPSLSVARDGWFTPLPSRTSDVLTAAELSAAPGLAGATAYDALVRLRPTFLRPRDARPGIIASRGILPTVFVDGMLSGGLEALRVIRISALADIQYVRAFDAVDRYGPDYTSGVILVRLRK